jgi:hypothetical protein
VRGVGDADPVLPPALLRETAPTPASGLRFPTNAAVNDEPVVDHLSDVYRDFTTGFCYTIGELVDDAGTMPPDAGDFLASCDLCCGCNRSILPSSVTVTATITGRGAGGPDVAVIPLDATGCGYGALTGPVNSGSLVFQAQLLGVYSPFDAGISSDTAPCGFVLNILSLIQDDGFPSCEFQLFLPGLIPSGAFTGSNLTASSPPGDPCHSPGEAGVSGTVS